MAIDVIARNLGWRSVFVGSGRRPSDINLMLAQLRFQIGWRLRHLEQQWKYRVLGEISRAARRIDDTHSITIARVGLRVLEVDLIRISDGRTPGGEFVPRD